MCDEVLPSPLECAQKDFLLDVLRVRRQSHSSESVQLDFLSLVIIGAWYSSPLFCVSVLA